MSNDEKAAQLGSAMTDLVEARRHRACLERKRSVMAEAIRRSAEALEASDLTHKDLPSSAERLQLVNELTATQDRIEDLEESLEAMGYPAGK